MKEEHLLLSARKILILLIEDRRMMKRIFLIFITGTLTVHSMDRSMQILHEYSQSDQHKDKLELSWPEVELEQRSTARAMSWLPALYDASGLKHCMSRECFMVNALQKIRESMANTRCCPGLQDCAQDVECLPARDWESLFMGANIFSSSAVALWTLIYGLTGPDKPLKFPETPVMGSCFRAEYIFGDSRGMEYAHDCQVSSYLINNPCNYTQLGAPRVSQCCFDIADPTCYQFGLRYNKETYPALHAQAVLDQWKPFFIAGTAIIIVQLGYYAGYKLRRYLKKRVLQPFEAPIPDAPIVEEITEVNA